MNMIFVEKADIFIHHPGQFFSPDSRARVDISPGFYKKIAINHEIVCLLSETGKCSDDFEVEDGRLNKFDTCIRDNLFKIMMTGFIICNIFDT